MLTTKYSGLEFFCIMFLMYHCIYVSQYLYITPILYPAFTVFLYHHHSVIGIFLGILCPCQCIGMAASPGPRISE